jgi:hypothetical protein
LIDQIDDVKRNILNSRLREHDVNKVVSKDLIENNKIQVYFKDKKIKKESTKKSDKKLIKE